LFSFGRNGEGIGEFNAPTGIAVDKRDNIIVADWGNSRIQVCTIANCSILSAASGMMCEFQVETFPIGF